MFSNAWLKEQSPQKLKQSPETQLGGVRMRSWDHEHFDLPLQKSWLQKIIFLSQKSRVQKTQLGVSGA
jgi:hypothetical protein